MVNREEETDVLAFLKQLIGCSNHLKRLVLYCEMLFDFTDSTAAAELRTFLTSFPSKMPRLVLICLVGIWLNSDDADFIKQYWREKILPDRPAFIHFFDSDLPKRNNPAIPRVHLDEIVRPIDWFFAPPNFNDIESQETDD